jgi:hypothetical protein
VAAALAGSEELPPPVPRGETSATAPRRPDTIGEAAVAPAGSQAATLQPDESLGHWRYALATGIAGGFGGAQLSGPRGNPAGLLYFGGEADGSWSKGIGQAARLRFRLFTGGTGSAAIYEPSDGELEAAFLVGRRELHFVVGRVEAGRYPALALDAIVQAGTLPGFEGSLSLSSDRMRLDYLLAPIEGAWVRYRGAAHLAGVPGWPSESGGASWASAARLRYSLVLAPAVLLSAQGDLVKLWGKADLLLSAEGSAAYQVLERSAALGVLVRWDGFTRRGTAPDTSGSDSQLTLLGVASLAF